MPTLFGALARGAAGFMEGRQQADAIAYQREQDRLNRERQKEQDDRQRAMMELQTEQIRNAMRIANENQARQGQADVMTATEKGYRPVGSPWDDINAAIGLPDNPTVTIGGQQMRKSANSNDWNTNLAQQRQQDAATAEKARLEADQKARILSSLPRNIQQQAAGLTLPKLMELSGKMLEHQMIPREHTPREPKLMPGADGNMYRYDERTGRMVMVPVAGMPMGGDQPSPQQAPVGDNLTTGLGYKPVAPPTAQQNTSTTQRGLFGKAPDDGISVAEKGKFRAAEESTKYLVNRLGEYRKLLAENGTAFTSVGSPAIARMQNIARDIQLKLKGPEFAQLGVLTGPDMSILEDVVSAPTGVGAKMKGADNILAQIDQVINNAETARRIRHEVYGINYQPIKPDAAPQSDARALAAQFGFPGRQ